MAAKNAGGAAVHAGVEYQQQVGAWLMTAMATDFDPSSTLGIPGTRQIERIRFETAAPIDDLQLTFHDHSHAWLQIKRQLSLSARADSDFRSTISQFLDQFLQNSTTTQWYLLTTSSETSKAVTKVLRFLLDAIRTDPDAWSSPTLNKDHRKTIKSLQKVIRDHLTSKKLPALTSHEMIAFCSRIVISVVDPGFGQPHAAGAHALLAAISDSSPDLLWSLLVTRCLRLASNRHSITRSALLAELQPYLTADDDHAQAKDAFEILHATGSGDSLTCGRELVVVEWHQSGADVGILEFCRFDDSCNRRISFSDTTVTWGEDDWCTNKVILRVATWATLDRMLPDIAAQMTSKHVVIIPANLGDEDVDQSACARLHAETCERLLKGNNQLHLCLHCARAISEHTATLVERDDDTAAHTVGLVHAACRRGVDRVMGYVMIPAYEGREYLNKLDLFEWARYLMGGQGLWSSLKTLRITQNGLTPIGWNPSNELWRDNDYCIEVQLENGSVRHVLSRGKLDRYDKPTAANRCKEFQSHLDSFKAHGDPFCYTSEQWASGPYSTVLSVKQGGEQILECVGARVVSGAMALARLYDERYYYAPLCRFVAAGSGEPVLINRVNVLLTDPIDLPAFKSNWAAAGIDLPPYELRILKSDSDFDAFVRTQFDKDEEIVIDPLADLQGRLVRGYLITDYEKVIASHRTSDRG